MGIGVACTVCFWTSIIVQAANSTPIPIAPDRQYTTELTPPTPEESLLVENPWPTLICKTTQYFSVSQPRDKSGVLRNHSALKPTLPLPAWSCITTGNHLCHCHHDPQWVCLVAQLYIFRMGSLLVYLMTCGQGLHRFKMASPLHFTFAFAAPNFQQDYVKHVNAINRNDCDLLTSTHFPTKKTVCVLLVAWQGCPASAVCYSNLLCCSDWFGSRPNELCYTHQLE